MVNFKSMVCQEGEYSLTQVMPRDIAVSSLLRSRRVADLLLPHGHETRIMLFALPPVIIPHTPRAILRGWNERNARASSATIFATFIAPFPLDAREELSQRGPNFDVNSGITCL